MLSNALEPGWVATRMGGPGAPDDLSLAPVTHAWLGVSDEPAATVTAGYFYHQQPRPAHPAARDAEVFLIVGRSEHGYHHVIGSVPAALERHVHYPVIVIP